MIETATQKILVYTCDNCGVTEKISEFDETPWITFISVEVNGVRLFERNSKRNSANLYNVPNGKSVAFCKKECAIKYLSTSCSIFISELTKKPTMT